MNDIYLPSVKYENNAILYSANISYQVLKIIIVESEYIQQYIPINLFVLTLKTLRKTLVKLFEFNFTQHVL